MSRTVSEVKGQESHNQTAKKQKLDCGDANEQARAIPLYGAHSTTTNSVCYGRCRISHPLSGSRSIELQ
jgi:hypothetical protein